MYKALCLKQKFRYNEQGYFTYWFEGALIYKPGYVCTDARAYILL